MSKPSADPLIGRVLDRRYTVQVLIARGGMATVYVAHDNRLDRDVALKILHPHLADNQNFIRRFYREAKLAAAVTNPHIVAMYDQGHDDDLCFLAMEYVQGQTLRSLLQNRVDHTGGLSTDKIFAIAIPVLEAMVAAHEAGLIHRDIKPENVLISRAGQVKVADFGLARASGTTTATATLLGTVAYAAPEVLHADTPDQRSDMYSFGIMLFELVTGRLPFTADAPLRVAFMQVNEPILAPSKAYAGTTDVFDEIVLWAAAKDPAERPSNARELLNRMRMLAKNPAATFTSALRVTTPLPPTSQRNTATLPQVVPARPDTIQTGPLVSTRPPYTAKATGRPVKARRARPWIVSAVAITLVAGLGVGGTYWWNEFGPGSLRTLPSIANLTLDQAKTLLKRNEVDAKSVEVFSDTVPAGVVVGSLPKPGDVSKHAIVTVSVSKGSEFIVAPSVLNQPQNAAETTLREAGFSVTVPEPQFDESVSSGNVITQSITSGEKVKRGSQVSLTVSKGKQPIAVPTNLVNMTSDSATSALSDLKLVPNITKEFSDTVAAGTVISQSPTEGNLYSGDTVNLVVSNGPELITIPNVVGQSLASAKQTLTSAGFQVTSTSYPLESALFNLVRAQSPSAGKQAPKGSTIRLNLV